MNITVNNAGLECGWDFAGREGERIPDLNKGKGTVAGTSWGAGEILSSESVCSGGGQALQSGTALLLRPAPVSTSVVVWRLNQVHRKGLSPH